MHYALLLLTLAACPREQRHLVEPPRASEKNSAYPVRQSSLQPGAALPSREVKNPFEGNAYAISEGQQLFEQYNCSGCHSHGGGGIGPPLMDDQWIYGSSPINIHDSIVQGRPQGMPSFGGHIPDEQVWKLVAYVRTLSNQESQNASPTRDEHLQAKRWEQPK